MNSDKEPVMKTAFEKAADIVAAKKQGQLTLDTVSCAVDFIGEMLEEMSVQERHEYAVGTQQQFDGQFQFP